MSWSIEIYTAREARLSEDELRESLREAAPSLELCDGTTPENWALCDPGTRERFALIAATNFRDESDADPELLDVLEREITDSDAEDGDLDEEYTGSLKDILRSARWHYTISAARDAPEAETATVRAAYGVAQTAGGLVHDMQSGAWMDCALFEEMLEGYNATMPF